MHKVTLYKYMYNYVNVQKLGYFSLKTTRATGKGILHEGGGK